MNACSEPLQPLRQTLRGRPARRLGSVAATPATSTTPSQLNAFCHVLFDSSDRLSKALARKSELLLGISDPMTWSGNDLRDMILGWIQAGWIRSLAIDYPDGTFYVARDWELLQNTCRNLRSAVTNRTPFILLAPWVSLLWDQPCTHDLLLLKKVQRACLDQCHFCTPWGKRTAVLSPLIDTHALARVCTFQTICSWSHRPHVRFGSVNASGISMARLSARLPKIICRCIARILQNAYRAQQASAMNYVLQSLTF